jgi:hypothetical protein
LFPEVNTLSQTVILPAGAEVTLRYQLWIALVTSPFTDTLEVRVDGVTQAIIDEPGTDEFFYSPETVDLSAYADGGAHTIQFRYRSPAFGGRADWHIDDVQVKICLPDFDGDGFPDVADPDDDNDGIPDFWEDANGLNAMDPTDAGIDGDGDGASGVDEYIADTSPTNTQDVLELRIEPRPRGSAAQPVSFSSSAAREYYIQFRPNLLTGTWLAGPTNIPGDGTTNQTESIVSPGSNVYFRLGAELP